MVKNENTEKEINSVSSSVYDEERLLWASAPFFTKFINIFNGRIGLKEYIISLGLIVLYVSLYTVLLLLYSVLLGLSDIVLFYIQVVMIMIPVPLIGISLTIRRLHDLGITGWVCLVGLIPIINIGLFLFLLLSPGEKVQNKYGSPNSSDTPFATRIFNLKISPQDEILMQQTKKLFLIWSSVLVVLTGFILFI